jgi:hypothetical protein
MYVVPCSTQATPRLGEDKVKQCVDPRLNGEYPPKGVAKVCPILSFHVSFICDTKIHIFQIGY